MRRLSLITPSGRLTLGNLLGALQPMADAAGPDAFYGLSDLHALTVPHSPDVLRARTQEMAMLLLAAGLSPATLFRQSAVPDHRSLAYLLECVGMTGELSRMIQFKEKSRRPGASVRTSLFTYPILMAADILLYDTEEVPVGDDQRQHVELARELATRFNTRYGDTFTVPRAVHPPVAARVMDLITPTQKMSKSSSSAAGVLRLLDEPDQLRRKIMRARTDDGDTVSYDRAASPGVANLLDILAGCTGDRPDRLAARFDGYGELKRAVADAVVDTLAPLRERYLRLAAEPERLRAVLRAGARRAHSLAKDKLRQAKSAIGLLPT